VDATAAAAKMLSDPDHFFKYYPVQMAGGIGAFVPNAANLKTYYLAKKNPAYAPPGQKVGHYGATRPGFLHTKDISSFKMDVMAAAGSSGALNTHGVPMVNYDSNKDGKVNLHGAVNAMDHYVVGAGASYMTTGLLTGCCFAWIPAPGGAGLWCVHVRPEGTTGVQLQNAIATNGHFAAAPHIPLSTFGRSDYGGGYAIIIGVDAATGWRIYSQTSGDQFSTITAAWRLYPGAVTRL
jgi:hypothetical protein